MLELLDYRRRVNELYAFVRQHHGNATAYQQWVETRNELFAHHPKSALDDTQRAKFTGLRYFKYDPAYRVTAMLETHVPDELFNIDLGEDGHFTYRRMGKVNFTLPTGRGALNIYWIEGYGGGIFLPFGDTTNRTETYGAGRYLYDTIKGADLGTTGAEMVLDFNFAYNPSCSYNYRWVCPLAPQENKLQFPINAGEKVLTM